MQVFRSQMMIFSNIYELFIAKLVEFTMKRKAIRVVKFKLEQKLRRFYSNLCFLLLFSFLHSRWFHRKNFPLKNETSMRFKIYGWSIPLWRWRNGKYEANPPKKEQKGNLRGEGCVMRWNLIRKFIWAAIKITMPELFWFLQSLSRWEGRRESTTTSWYLHWITWWRRKKNSLDYIFIYFVCHITYGPWAGATSMK